MALKGVPVVMYHGVGPPKPGWDWNILVMPLDVFEGQMRMLKEEGWTAITLRALYDHMATGAPLPDKPIVLTFDDGYLDNWVFAYPILKKYGHHAVIWMSTGFVDPRPGVRPTLEDVSRGNATEADLPITGYLSWDEMRAMVEHGVIEIQSHARTHTRYFKGPRIVDFHRPRGVEGYIPYQWLAWNRSPERKYAWLTDELESAVPYGTPIYEDGQALAVRRYFEDEALTERLVRHVADTGGARFFERSGWREILMKIAEDHGDRDDRIETAEEYRARVRDELVGSRGAIEAALGVEPEFLCWPGGGRSPENLLIAEEAGYLATTTHYLDPHRRNVHGQNPREINRTGCCSPWIWRGHAFYRTDPGYFRASLEKFNGSNGALWRMRLYKMKYILRYLVSKRD
jgi:peptidoglycan/xylan/chitin deacetylase (PgdA/CDA1 family)